MKHNTALNISRIFIVFLLIIIASKPIFAQKWVDMGVKSDNGQPLYWADGDLIKENGSFRIGEHSEIGTKFYWGDPNGGTNAAIGSNIPNHITGNKKYDVVSANTEYPNRMPSNHEFMRLIYNCKLECVNLMIKKGEIITDSNDFSWIYGVWGVNFEFNNPAANIVAAANGNAVYKIQLNRDNTYIYAGYLGGRCSGKFEINKTNRRIDFKGGCLSGEHIDIKITLGYYKELLYNGDKLGNFSNPFYQNADDTYMYFVKLTSKINGNVLYFAIEENNGKQSHLTKSPIAYWTGSSDKSNGNKAYAYDYDVEKNNVSSVYRTSYYKIRPVRDYAQRDVSGYNSDFGIVSFNYSNKEFDGSEIYVDGKKIPEKLKDGLEIVVGSGSKEILIKTQSKWYSDQTKKVTVAYRENTTVKVDLPPKFSNVKITAGSIYDSISVDNEFVGKGKWEGRLMFGSHNVESRNIYYHPHSMKIDVQKKGAVTFQVPALKRKTLDIDIDSKPQGANVTFDGKNLGTTPLKLNNIPAGSTKTLEISKKNMTPYKCQLTFDEVKIKNVQDVELPSYCVGGSKLSNKGNLDIGVKLHRMHRNIFDYKPIFRNRFYYVDLLACGDYDSWSIGGGFNIGIYFRKLPFNLETGLRVDTNYDFWMPLKFGYGFVIKGDMRITPQIGYDILTTKDGSFSLGARFEYGIYNFISVGVVPLLYFYNNSFQIDTFISFFFPTRITRSEYKLAKDYSSAGYKSEKETKNRKTTKK